MLWNENKYKASNLCDLIVQQRQIGCKHHSYSEMQYTTNNRDKVGVKKNRTTAIVAFWCIYAYFKIMNLIIFPRFYPQCKHSKQVKSAHIIYDVENLLCGTNGQP